MRYFKSRKQDAQADLLAGSAFMQQVSRPEGVNASDVSIYRYAVIKHPTLEEYALAVPESDMIPVHPAVASAAQTEGNFPAQEAFINNAGESKRIREFVRDNGHANGHDLAPARWDEKTRAELEAEGFFQ
jgi:hypothetical protein